MSKEFKEILSNCLIQDLEEEEKSSWVKTKNKETFINTIKHREKAHWTLTPPKSPGLYFVSKGDLGQPAHETKTTYVISVVRLDIPQNSIWYSDGVIISMNPQTVWNGYWYSKPIKMPKFKKEKK